MCLSPVTIVNPHKYVSLNYRDRYLLQVPCGKCAECQSQMSNQWMYRTYYEFSQCLENQGFIYFDTLTYAPEHLPRLNRLLRVDENYPCFNPDDITKFLKRLRRRYDDKSIRYFVSSEYGEHTHRPHYHVLFFVTARVTPIVFSRDVAACWQKGRTDGLPFKSCGYVLFHNTIHESNMANILRTINYVTKYVQKNCTFQKELDRRINEMMDRIADDFDFLTDYETDYSQTLEYKQLRQHAKRLVNQFHRQSLHYGESALSQISVNQLFKDGCLFMPHFKAVKIPIVLPTYYKRKLFYRLIEVDNCKMWQLNDLGKQYQRARQSVLLADLESRFKSVCLQYHLNFNCHQLADYVLNWRGRLKAGPLPVDFEQKLKDVCLFNYVTPTDRNELGHVGLYLNFLGNTKLGYSSEKSPYLKIKDFIAKYVILDPDLEEQLSKIYYYTSFVDTGKQKAYELKQRLTSLFKCFL